MKYSKRYIAFTVVILFVFLVKFHVLGVDNASVGRFRGGTLEAKVWNPLVAKDVNSNQVKALIDNQEYTSDQVELYMNKDRNIMVPVSMLRDALNCSARVYDNDRLLVEKHNLSVSLSLDEKKAYVNGEDEKIKSALTKVGGKLYVSLNDLSNLLGYKCDFDITKNTVVAADTDTSALVPTYFDLREKGRVSKIRNQGTYGTCWSFAALSAMESVLLPEQDYQFSVDHMTLNNGFHLAQDDGGEYTMGMAYLASWKGPVFEKDDPYGDNKTNPDLTAVKHVQEMQIIDGKDYEKIKEAVFKYGGVQTSIYNSLKSSQSKSPYYDRRTSSYCYIGTEKPNHDVVIIGWDDSYSKDNFSVDLEGDGAFICQNSWGSEFGDGGIFYISYYDTNIGTHNVVYTGIEDSDNYDHIYQSDLCGWVGQLGYNKDSIYGANVFTAEGNETLKAASFYATGKDSQYELYVVRQFEDETSLEKMIPVASGKLGNAGYYTVDFNQGIEVDAGERYAVVLYIITPGSVHPMAIEYAADEATENVDLDDGESYISANGSKWVSVDTVEKSNLCIKAFSDNR